MSLSPAQFRNYAGYITARVITDSPPEAAYYRQFYRMLKAYVANNGLYEWINQELEGVRLKNKDIQPLRNPAGRCVEFYAAKLWPGHDLEKSLPIITENEQVLEPISLVWQWSNFAIRKQRAARQFAMLGDMFIKLNTKVLNGDVTAVYFQFIDATYVSEFELDERGFITYIRLDIPIGENEKGEQITHTEVWDKETQTWNIWTHIQGLDVDLERINQQPDNGTFDEVLREDFVPFVYVPFQDDGNGRANGAFVRALDKIDEVNAKATRLGQLLFRHNRADKALISEATDSSGRPLAPPKVNDLLDDSKIKIDGEMFYRLPSGWDIKNLVAQLDYESHLNAIAADIVELEQDLPELVYSRISESDNLSGRALRYMLEGAISRLLEARGNGENAFVRATQMALSIGRNFNLFSGLGDFGSGSLNFVFDERPVLLPDNFEIAQTASTWVQAGASLEQAAIEAGVKEQRAQELARGDVIPPDTPDGEDR